MAAVRGWVAAFIVLAATADAAEPPVMAMDALGDHVGEIVTVEGDVVSARTEADTCVLEFTADDPTGFRAVLLVPVLSSLPRHPERLYAGKRVRVSGRVQRFQSRPEMVLRNPDQIAVVGVAMADEPAAARRTAPVAEPEPAPPAPAAPTPPAPAPAAGAPSPPAAPAIAEPAAVAPPAPGPAAVEPPPPPTEETADQETADEETGDDEAPPARGLVGEVAARLDPCTRARDRWRTAATAARARADALSRCLAATTYQCRAAASAMAPALTDLEWSQQDVDDACR
jgi:hypothetical protein